MDGWMVDKDPHAFKLNFGTQSLISDKPWPPPPSHSDHALAKLNPAFGDQDPGVSRPLHMSFPVSGILFSCPPRLVSPLHHADLSPGTAASGKDFPGWLGGPPQCPLLRNETELCELTL